MSVQTLAGPRGGNGGANPPSDDSVNVTYAPFPQVTDVSTGTTPTAGPTSGGTPVTIRGIGFDTADTVVFYDRAFGFSSTAYNLTSVSDTKVTVKAPAALVGTDAVLVCNDSGCSSDSGPPATFDYYLPGTPQLLSATPTHGKTGTVVTVDGRNLGNLTSVSFGNVTVTGKAIDQFPKGFDGFESGSTTSFTVKAPASLKGKAVNIRVQTIESEATGSGKSKVVPGVTFTRTG